MARPSTPSTLRTVRVSVQEGSKLGLGLHLNSQGKVAVNSVTQGSLAEAEGLQLEWHLKFVNGQSVEGFDIQGVLLLIQGVEGTLVLDFVRPDYLDESFDESVDDDKPLEAFTFDDGPLGIELKGKKGRIKVRKVHRHSAAAAKGVQVHSELVRVNETPLTNLEAEKVLEVLQTSERPLTLYMRTPSKDAESGRETPTPGSPPRSGRDTPSRRPSWKKRPSFEKQKKEVAPPPPAKAEADPMKSFGDFGSIMCVRVRTPLEQMKDMECWRKV